MQQGTAHHPSPAVVEALALPSLTGLSERQVRGTTCVWNGVALTPGMVFDLGPRTTMRAGEPLHWFPRACPACIAQQAQRALHAHAPFCEQCQSPGNVEALVMRPDLPDCAARVLR
jgi:hypothetical protein